MRFTEEVTATPGQFIAALTDLGEGRERIWGNSANSYLKVLGQDSTEANVTEGSGGVLGHPALRLVRSQPGHPDHDLLKHLGWQVRMDLYVLTPARRDDQGRR
jgi:hypothetical protein